MRCENRIAIERSAFDSFSLASLESAFAEGKENSHLDSSGTMGNENRNPNHRHSKAGRTNHRRSFKLQVERLECRRLLAGLNVSVYIDQSSISSDNPASVLPAANRIIYIDLDRSGSFDDGEPVAITDHQGDAFFEGLQPGEYSLGVLTNPQFQRLVDPVAVSRSESQVVGSDIRSLSGDAAIDFSPLLGALKSARQLDFLVAIRPNEWFVGARLDSDNTVLELIDSQGFAVYTQVVEGKPIALVEDASTGRLALATDQATFVYQMSDSSIETLAILADAAAPLALRENRLASSDRMNPGGWVIWDTNNWIPISRDRLSDDAILDIAFSDDGKRIMALTEGRVHTSEFVGTNAVVSISETDEVAEVRFGVELIESLPELSFDPIETRRLIEDSVDQLDLSQILNSPEGISLWFGLDDSPQKGRVELTTSGRLDYTPSPGFTGQDQVSIRVFNGVSQSQLVLNWEVEETNKPPSGIIIDIPAFAADTPIGSELGFVTIVDPNSGASYRVTTSDPRFRVEYGRLYLDGELDFENEPFILLEFLAVDEYEQFSITTTATLTVLNATAPPMSVLLSSNSVNEKTSNIIVGELILQSITNDADYEILVDDSRFIVEGNQLRLIEALNRQKESEVVLVVSVIDRSSSSPIMAETFTLTVNAVHDAPSDIAISSLRVPELTPGGVIGKLTALGLSDGDAVEYQVSDDRFEVVEGVLKLRDNTIVNRSAGTDIAVAVTAIGSSGAALTVTFPLIVVPPPSPWQNPANPADVNGDGRVSALDALQIINYLNQNGPGTAPPLPPNPDGQEGTGEPPRFFPDVNGDGRVTALDVLLIINQLNIRTNIEGPPEGGENAGDLQAEGESGLGPTESPNSTSMSPIDDLEQRRKNNSRIDSELESLLDQLSRDHRS